MKPWVKDRREHEERTECRREATTVKRSDIMPSVSRFRCPPWVSPPHTGVLTLVVGAIVGLSSACSWGLCSRGGDEWLLLIL